MTYYKELPLPYLSPVEGAILKKDLNFSGELTFGLQMRYDRKIQAYLPLPPDWIVADRDEGHIHPHATNRQYYRYFLPEEPHDEKTIDQFKTGLIFRVIKHIKPSSEFLSVYSEKFQKVISEILNIQGTYNRPIMDNRLKDIEIISSEQYVSLIGVSAEPTIERNYSQPAGCMQIEEYTLNKETGTSYYIYFRSPAEQWNENEALGRTILNNKRLNPSF